MVLTGMLMAWAESCSFLTRRPKYSSLQQHTEMAAVTSCNTRQNTLPASQTKVILPDKPLLPESVLKRVSMGCQHAAQACCWAWQSAWLVMLECKCKSKTDSSKANTSACTC